MPGITRPAGATAKAIWEYATRVLTNLPDTKAARIDKIITLEELSAGTLTADGTEQELVSAEGMAIYHGLISLDQMTMGDQVAVSVYIKMTGSGSWKRYYRNEYIGPQTNPVLHFLLKVARHGFRVTLHQFAGSLKTFEYSFYKES